MLIRIYGDSLSLPRNTDGISFAGTYPELLRRALLHDAADDSIYIYNRSRGGGTAPVLYSDYLDDETNFGTTDEQVVIIQCGVCDCAPRPIPNRLKRIISRMPSPLKRRVIDWLHANRAAILRSGFRWQDVNEKSFTSTMHRWMSGAAANSIIVAVINIPPTTPNIEMHSPGFGQSILTYNEILRDIVGRMGENVALIDVHNAVLSDEDGVNTFVNAKDGHHITRAGHELFSSMVHSVVARGLADLGRNGGA